MKKYFTLVFLLMFFVKSFALKFKVNGITYEVTSTQELTLKVVESNNYDYYGDVVIPENVKYNGKTFTVTAIGDYTFVECSRVTSLSIPKTVESIGIQLFNGGKSLKAIKVDKDNPYFCDVDGVLFSKDTTIMYYYPTAKSTSYKLPKETKVIRESCFSLSWNLAKIIFNEGLEEIGKMSFYYVKLTELIFPSTLKKIDYGAFLRATDIKKVVCKSKTPPEGAGFDDATYLDATLYVPKGSLEKYKNAFAWNAFYDIQEYDESELTAAANIDAANEVVSEINAIGIVEYTDVCKSRIDAARSAYDALTTDQQALVTNYNVLTGAERKYENLKNAAEIAAANAAAAKVVADKIDAIGNVEYTDACWSKIEEARSAYNALTKEQQALVANYSTLTNAENAYKQLEETLSDIAEISKEPIRKEGKFFENNKIVIIKNNKKYNTNGLLK